MSEPHLPADAGPDAGSLDYIFFPKQVAVIGATEKQGSVGRTLFWNLISNPFGGTIYPVNAQRPQVLGVRAYPSVSAVPGQVDLAVICIPSKGVPAVVQECVQCGVKGIVIISAGFKEAGPAGVKLEEAVREAVQGTDVRIIGPNCLGVMSPVSGLNATFGKGMALPGKVAFISQSGALCTAILDWSINDKVGFSAFVSIGSMLDVNWGDLIDYFGNDRRTEAIVIYMESVGDARAFLSAARAVAMVKPIIVIKAGRSAAAAKAAASHTGSLTGSDDVLDAAFKRVGVMRVDRISDLFAMAETLAKQPLPTGPQLTIVTNAGGPGVLATDALVLGGGKLTELSPATLKALDAILPPHWSHNNPIDILGDADPEKYAKALEIAAKDDESHGMMVVLTPQDMTDPTRTAEALKPYGTGLGKPVLASWMGAALVSAGCDILNRANIPTFEHPDDACRAFNYLWQYSASLQAIYETPLAGDNIDELMASRVAAQEIILEVARSGRTLLNEFESKELLAAYGIPTVRTEVARTGAEAVKWAAQIGYPVVVKLFSNTITHKTDVGGVKLNLKDAAAVEEAFAAIGASVAAKHGAADFAGVTVQPMIKMEGYEVILGSSLDPQFGPVLLFGAGGQLVEVFRDSALGLPPLTTTQARRMMAATKIFTALKGVRGRASADIGALEQLLVRFSYLVSQEARIKELDINPLLVAPGQLLALDARVVLHGPEVADDNLPQPAIRPYPLQYLTKIQDQQGRELVVRPVKAEDEAAVVRFHQGLSDETVLQRFLRPVSLEERAGHSRLARICFADYARELGLMAVYGGGGAEEIVGACRIVRRRLDPHTADVYLVVTDAWQRRGIGSQLMRYGIDVARRDGIRTLAVRLLVENTVGAALCRTAGFQPVSSDRPERQWLRLEL